VGAARYIALTGGIGGAKLARGLAARLEADALSFIVNPGDDFEFNGVTICPDTDTLLYTLAGLHDEERGWGRRDERWTVHETLTGLGEDTWFRMGDRDLAMSLLRTGHLAAGESLTAVTRLLADALGIEHAVLPPSDDPVRTVVETVDGEELDFQDYFVRLRGEPVVRAFRFAGAGDAILSLAVREALSDPALAGIVICPSNPFISIDPILAVPGMRGALRGAGVPIVAVSPIVGGDAVKGPLARILRGFSLPVSAATIARHYHDLLDGFVLDRADESDAADVEALGIATCVTDTLMTDDTAKANLADACLGFIGAIAPARAARG